MSTALTVRLSESIDARRDIPLARVDRLFEKLAALYGKHWLDAWADVPMADVKNAWQEALEGCSGQQIKLGLDHVQRNNRFPPTAPEFAIICRGFRDEPAQRLALPIPRTAMPDDVRQKLRAFVAKVSVEAA